MKTIISYIIAASFLFTSIHAQTPHNKKTSPKSNKNPKPQKTFSQKTTQLYKDSILLSKSIKADSLSKIRAILVVGHVEESTPGFIAEMKTVAAYLKTVGVKVKEFYDPYANWSDIKIASENAHIFIYAGHGTNLGEQGKSGGLCLSKNTTISSDSIIHSLKLHKNSLVIFNHVCEGAGSSAADNSDIGVKIALQRVSDYSSAFIKLGSAAYYVNNFNNSIIPFFKNFFARKSIKDVYTSTLSSNCNIETIQKYPYDQNFEISVASKKPYGFSTRTSTVNGIKKVEKLKDFKSYEIAFVARPNFTVLDFFK
jgi:hypothetical protein